MGFAPGIAPATGAGVSVRDCPACRSARTFQVIDSRQSGFGRRRRYACTVCNHRDSTQEIDQATFEQLQSAQRALERIRAAITSATGDTLPQPPVCAVPCVSCGHAIGTACTLELPEAFTPDAAGCPSHLPD